MLSIVNIILNILTSGLPCCLLALGIFLTYRILDFADLTAEGSFLIGASVTAAIIYQGGNPFLATLAGCFGGTVCGFITGILNRILKIPKLLSGIITMTATASIAMLIMGLATGGPGGFAAQIPLAIMKDGPQQTIYSVFWPWNKFNPLITCIVMLVVVVIAMLAIYFFFGTEYGMAIRTTGLNENMARSQGIDTTIASIVAVAISNGLIGLAGALYIQQAWTVSTISATGYLVIGLASILIGEAIFGKRSFKNWIISVAAGSIVYFTIITIAVELGLPTQLKSLLYACLITLALCLPALKKVINTYFYKIKAKKEKQNA